jgi:hypothetical protein
VKIVENRGVEFDLAALRGENRTVLFDPVLDVGFTGKPSILSERRGEISWNS